MGPYSVDYFNREQPSCSSIEYFVHTFNTLLQFHDYQNNMEEPEAVARRCSVKKVFLKISQNSQPVSFLIKLRPATLLKKRLQHRCLLVSFVKFLRTPFFIEHLRWLLLKSTLTTINGWYRWISKKCFWCHFTGISSRQNWKQDWHHLLSFKADKYSNLK